MTEKLRPLNMHGDTETWEEAMVRVSRERDEWRRATVDITESSSSRILDLEAEVARLREIASAAQRRQEELERERDRLRAALQTHHDQQMFSIGPLCGICRETLDRDKGSGR